MVRAKLSIVFALLAVLMLTGSQCVLVATSGSSGDADKPSDEQQSNLVVVIRSGRFVDAPVQGLGYRSGTLAGVTGPNGEFEYLSGEAVQFHVGDLMLGRAVPAKALVTPVDLVADGSMDTPGVVNISRLLQSLDRVPGDDRITIPAEVGAAAVRSNAALFAAIEHIDFQDSSAFDNSAAQLVATLTHDYPFTVTLIDAQTARTHLFRSLAAVGLVPAATD
jgi:hypothetical protein